MLRRLLAVPVLLSLCVLCWSKKKAENQVVFPDVTERGRALYEYDEAAWHATDAVRATNPPDEAVGRYIARKTDVGWKVVFGHLNTTHDKFLIAYEASQGAKPQDFSVKKLDPPVEDASFYLAAAKAIDTALQDFRGEKRPYNVAVLPASSNQTYVYVVPAQVKDDVYPLGGDVRYTITSDCTAIAEKRQLHKTILENDPSSLPKGAKDVAGYHTHVLSEVPEDTDVFHVLTQKPPRPEYVATMKKKLYIINADGTILEGKL